MPNNQNRPSMKQTLEDRYNDTSIKIGGAFDARSVVTEQGKRSTNGGAGFGTFEVLSTYKDFVVKMPQGKSDMKYVDSNGKTAIPNSIKNLSTVKYKP